jgi:hypothetical protein
VGSLINQPILDLDFLACPKASYDVVGSAIDGGRNGLGETQTIEMSGGGLVSATLEDCKIVSKEQMRYINRLGARLNGGFRYIVVPIPTDYYGPFPTIGRLPTPFVTAIPNSDGSLFSVGTDYTEATVYGEVTEAAALNAGILKVRVFGFSRAIEGDWFSISHPTKGWRAYRDWDVLAVTVEENPVYTLALSPPLREAVTVGTRVEFARPRFVAKFKADFTLPSVIEAFFVTQQTIQFSEAF